jgi:hypothetical protein
MAYSELDWSARGLLTAEEAGLTFGPVVVMLEQIER